jgi:hypothetical protein
MTAEDVWPGETVTAAVPTPMFVPVPLAAFQAFTVMFQLPGTRLLTVIWLLVIGLLNVAPLPAGPTPTTV